MMASSSTADPLLLLRQAIITDPSLSSIQWLDSQSEPTTSLSSSAHISLPSSSPDSSSLTFPKSTPTRYTSTPTAQEFYDLATLVYAYQTKDLGVGEYLKNAREDHVGFVAITDRRNLVDWLSGKLELANTRIVDQIDTSRKDTVTATATSTSTTTTTTTEEGTNSHKRPLEPTQETIPTSQQQQQQQQRHDPSSNLSATATATTTEGARPVKKQAYAPDREDSEKMVRLMQIVQGPNYAYLNSDGTKVEREGFAVKNRETVLRGERTNNFESVLNLLGPRLKAVKDDHFEQRSVAPTPSASSAPSPAASVSSSGSGRSGKRKNNNPIIILSPSDTALLNLHNVKTFLEDSVYVDPREAKRLFENDTTDMVMVNHARTTSSISSVLNASTNNEPKKVRYFVVNSVEALAKFGSLDDAWDRVVCVMTTGQEWQFKPYKWREPKELFHHVKGIFVQYTNEPVNPKVRSWNVTELRIDPSKRHIDKSTVADFWRSLEAWIAMYKPHLNV